MFNVGGPSRDSNVSTKFEAPNAVFNSPTSELPSEDVKGSRKLEAPALFSNRLKLGRMCEMSRSSNASAWDTAAHTSIGVCSELESFL